MDSLYTGINSQSFVKDKEKKDERKKEQSKQRKELLPVGELIKVEFAKEIDSISHIDYVALEKLTDDFEIKSELMAQKRTIDMLRSIEQRLMNLLRDNKDI